MTKTRERGTPLSPREKEVLKCLATGISVRAIAEKLGIASSTVGAHKKSLFQKLGVHSERAAVAVGLKDGIIR